MFELNGRHAGIAVSRLILSDGTIVAYVQRRFSARGETLTVKTDALQSNLRSFADLRGRMEWLEKSER